MKSRIVDHWKFIVLLSLGTFLRFFQLGRQSLWLDEVVTVRDASHSFKEIPYVIASYPPLWAFIVRCTLLVAGHNDFWLRVPAAFFGSLTILAFYYIAERLFNRQAALWGTALMAFSTFDILYSQEVRMYTLAPLEILMSLYFWTMALERDETRWWAAYAAISVVALFTHNWYPLFLFGQGLWFSGEMVARRRLSKRGIMAFFVIAGLYTVWIPFLQRQTKLPVYGPLRTLNLSAIRETIYALDGIRVPSGAFWVGVGRDARLPILIFSLILLVIGIAWPGEHRRRAVRIFIAGCFVPLAAAFLIGRVYLFIIYPLSIGTFTGVRRISNS